ncbi:hypothetical protein [Larsenimonas suaedae]|uniref:Uncharacterized protein n=1 Tax=Larsenimonas suaedae TaxID=1851019 RepID=A0ABU1GZ17_9GAMM|nr:hypothetical protein [Larsenimonas suaedae]MCM2973768.1 hypothetical protein [Larsenimonas suaedae]MDR5897292.1 hypothetical protein [Larsenimonas suaedae]
MAEAIELYDPTNQVRITRHNHTFSLTFSVTAGQPREARTMDLSLDQMRALHTWLSEEIEADGVGWRRFTT